jgi:hypothetical protein
MDEIRLRNMFRRRRSGSLIPFGNARAPDEPPNDRTGAFLADVCPRRMFVRVGTTVVWHNRGGGENQHNVVADDSSFRSGDISPGLTFAHTFSAPGRYV